MFYTVLDSELNKVLTGSWLEVHTWFESKTYKEVYHVYNHQTMEFTTSFDFWTDAFNFKSRE